LKNGTGLIKGKRWGGENLFRECYFSGKRVDLPGEDRKKKARLWVSEKQHGGEERPGRVKGLKVAKGVRGFLGMGESVLDQRETMKKANTLLRTRRGRENCDAAVIAKRVGLLQRAGKRDLCRLAWT